MNGAGAAVLRTLIVDDEPPARALLRRHVDASGGFQVVGESEGGCEAVHAIDELAPHLVFLDVQMPGLDGFGVLRMLEGRRLPAVVFVTAHDEYALRAFDVHALDYVLKPFGPGRLDETLSLVRERLGASRLAAPEALAAACREARPAAPPLEWLLVKAGTRSVLLNARDIDWIEAAGNNVVLHVREARHPFPATLKAFEAALDPARFVRIHRGTIVNLERVRELEPWFSGDYKVTLQDGHELTLSAGFREGLTRFRRLPA